MPGHEGLIEVEIVTKVGYRPRSPRESSQDPKPSLVSKRFELLDGLFVESEPQPIMNVLDQAKVAMERNGVSVRIAGDIVSKRYYPDIYEWVKFQCSIWAYTGRPPPSADYPRYELFAERNTNSSGEIETTHHIVWVGGVKMENPPNYWEYQHFKS